MSQRGIFYTTEKLGPKQSLTPEGFLLCEDVAVARTGMLIYGPNETPIEAGPEGLVKIFREPEDVFHLQTIASAQGKPVTNDHPEKDVTPATWKELTHGIALNVRRGEGAYDDLLLADFLITTSEGIEAVQSGKREVSCGYEADYEETAPGVGKQTNIIINHIALVEQGRCGPRCAIGDHKPLDLKGDSQMTAKSKGKILDALMKAFKAKDADEVEKLAKEVEGDGELAASSAGEEGDTHIHIHGGGTPGNADERVLDGDALQAHIDQYASDHAALCARLDALEKAASNGVNTGDDEDQETKEAMLDEIPEELQESAAKANDSSYLRDSFKDTVALAEILAPGIRVPTFDKAAKPLGSFKAICSLRRQALDAAYVSADSHGVIADLLGGKKLDTVRMTCDAVRALFRSAAAMKRSSNNGKSQTIDFRQPGEAQKAPLSLADLNKLNAAHYAK